MDKFILVDKFILHIQVKITVDGESKILKFTKKVDDIGNLARYEDTKNVEIQIVDIEYIQE